MDREEPVIWAGPGRVCLNRKLYLAEGKQSAPAPHLEAVGLVSVTTLLLFALPLLAYCSEQGLGNGTVSVRLSVPAWAHNSKSAVAGLLL